MKYLRDLIINKRNNGKVVGPNSKLMKDFRNSLPVELSLCVRAMLVGLMLGDISIQINPAGTAARLKFEWGDVNKEYAYYVYSLLQEYCLEIPRRQVRINAKGNIVVTWCFQTVTHPAFIFLHQLFIVNGIKCILPDILIHEITPVSLAFWFMDDGGSHTSRYGLQLHTQGFLTHEVESLCTILRNRFDLDCWVKISKGKPTIVISGHSYDKFFGLVKEYIHVSMRRKFPKLSKTTWN
jgi:LAGLIDADG DNA endonuclease family